MSLPSFSLKTVNTILLALIILVDGYIIVAPFVPGWLYSYDIHRGDETKLEKLIKQPSRSNISKPNSTSEPNHIVVPSMLLNAPIYTGPERDQYQILNKGIWLFQWGGTPATGGNTVLVGHRFTYTNPRGIFYFLNKVQVGDPIAIWWNNKEYVYKVATINEVPPSDTSIENWSATPKLTMFTCTPLWNPKDRLVVVAYPEVS
jgi:LPXTG-site transpeptidase (sortase) family protein